MKKFIAVIFALILMNILSAEVCWDNGIPIYEGNFIYSSESVVTQSGNIYITWVELQNGNRQLKLQKTNYAGQPIWSEPKTIEENSDFIIENGIVAYGDDGCYIDIIYPNNNRKEQKLFKLDSDGNTIWTVSYNLRWDIKLNPISNGGILVSQIGEVNDSYILQSLEIDENGNIVWNNQNLYNFNGLSSAKILNEQYINGFSYFLLESQDSSFLLKVNENGEIVSQSQNYPCGIFANSSFADDNFFVFSLNNQTDNLEMIRIDLDGNSVLPESPKVICNANYWLANKVAFADDYFYAVLTNTDDHAVFKKCDFDGNVLASYTLNENVYYQSIQVYDYDTDFIATNINGGSYTRFLIKLNEDGISEPIYYMPDNISNGYYQKYFINGNFSFVGIKKDHLSKIITMRKTDDTTVVNVIRNVENDIISPTIKKYGSILYTYWYSQNHDAIMLQRFDENGNILNEANGSAIIDNTSNFYLTENRIIAITNNPDDTILTISSYSLNGEYYWSEQIPGNIDNYHIYPFNGNNILVIKHYIDSEHFQVKLMAFDENGFLWDEPASISIDSHISQMIMNGNVLFVRSYHEINYYTINSDGTYSEPQLLASNSQVLAAYGSYDKFIVITQNGTSPNRDLHYFQNGNLMWETPWGTNLSQFGNIKMIFEDDGFYIIGYHYSANNIIVRKYDYYHNAMGQFDFDYTIQNHNLTFFNVFKKDGKFIFYIHSIDTINQDKLTYLITDESGNVLVPESPENIFDRAHIEFTRDAQLVNGSLYLSIACGYKPMEGEYQRTFYVQKVDLSGFVNSEDENIPAFSPQLSNYPNPFNPTTTISFDLPKSGNVDLSIYNIKGQKVKTLTSEKYSKGKHSLIWNGTNNENQNVGSGVYFYKLNVNGKTVDVKKCILLK